MTTALKQHLIDPEICIRCYTCEMTCTRQAIEHDDTNVVVDASKCEVCLDCIPVCPTGAIDEWRMVAAPYSLADQYGWSDLPAPAAPGTGDEEDSGADAGPEALDPAIDALLGAAHSGAGGKARPPASAARPVINMYTIARPATATVQGNYRLTAPGAEADVRHIILSFEGQPFPVLEGQSIGIVAPGSDAAGKPHLPRLYSVSSPRDGERPGFGNVSLTVKREPGGVCSNHVCDLRKGDKVRVTGPFGSTFLMPDDAEARLLMICTGTGSAPMRAFTMRRQRTHGGGSGGMTMFFGARTPDSLPYFGPLAKVPDSLLVKHLVFSRLPGRPREYVQDRMLAEQVAVAGLLGDARTHVYICGLRAMEAGVTDAFTAIARTIGQDWTALRATMRAAGRYHVETY